MAVKFAAAYGCDVTAFTSSERKFNEAKGFGANHVVSRTIAARLSITQRCSCKPARTAVLIRYTFPARCD